MKKEKLIKAWAVLKKGKLKTTRKDEWTLPIMLDEKTARAYSFWQKDEKVIPCIIILCPNPTKGRGQT